MLDGSILRTPNCEFRTTNPEPHQTTIFVLVISVLIVRRPATGVCAARREKYCAGDAKRQSFLTAMCIAHEKSCAGHGKCVVVLCSPCASRICRRTCSVALSADGAPTLAGVRGRCIKTCVTNIHDVQISVLRSPSATEWHGYTTYELRCMH